MSESARGEGGRIWTYKDGKPWYFLEEKYPDYGNLVPRDIATREIFDVCVNQKLGINGENMVYLDLSHKDPHELDVKLGGIIEIYEKFTGEKRTLNLLLQDRLKKIKGNILAPILILTPLMKQKSYWTDYIHYVNVRKCLIVFAYIITWDNV